MPLLLLGFAVNVVVSSFLYKPDTSAPHKQSHLMNDPNQELTGGIGSVTTVGGGQQENGNGGVSGSSIGGSHSSGDFSYHADEKLNLDFVSIDGNILNVTYFSRAAQVHLDAKLLARFETLKVKAGDVLVVTLNRSDFDAGWTSSKTKPADIGHAKAISKL